MAENPQNQNKNDNKKPENERKDNPDAEVESAAEKVTGEKEYILLDKTFYKYDNAQDKKGKAGKRYKQGDRIKLSGPEAETLLAGVRPSVRPLTDAEAKDKDD